MAVAYMIWLTTACNLRCKYCYEGTEKVESYLSEKDAAKIIDYITRDCDQTKNLQISFHGGEPFLNYKIMKFISIELEKRLRHIAGNITYQVTTNATILNKEIIDFLREREIEVTCSLDGTKETHDSIRVFEGNKGSYDIAMKNSLQLLELFPDLRVRMTVRSTGVENLSRDIIHLVEKGFKLIVPVLDFYDKNWNEEKFEIIKEEIRRVKAYVGNRKVTISLLEPLGIKKKSPCQGGIQTKNIYPNGDIYPCTLAAGDEEFLIGNIEQGINSKKLDEILSNSKRENKECSGCTFYNFCNSTRCKIINKLITGDYNSPNSLECNMNHLLYEENGFSCL